MRKTTALASVIGATSLLAGLAASPAFAANPPGGTPSQGLAVTVVVPSTVQISLDESTTTLTATPGTTVSSSPEPVATVVSNDSQGYQLLVGVTAPFADSASQVIPDTAFQAFQWAGNNQANGGTYAAFDAAGDALTVFQTTATSGHISSGNGNLSSPGDGSDHIESPLQLALPGNQPTSNSGYSGALTYWALGA